jgi:hypothetical protein
MISPLEHLLEFHHKEEEEVEKEEKEEPHWGKIFQL